MASAAILVGGAARRFGGRDKSTLVVGGRTILDRQLGELSEISDDLMIVGGTGPSAVFRRPDGPAGRTVPDRVPGSGPLGGLDAALAAARDADVIVLACDMPCVTAALLQYLLTLAPGYDAVVPRTERGYHPLCAVYTRACRRVVAERLADRRLALRGMLEDIHVREVGGEELEGFGDRRRLFANVNTPAEFEELEALQGHDR
jgi:molybdopterin-guanine dinucleotide biosynthesis protein A